MYAYKELYTLDFRSVTDYMDVHRVIKRELDFPDYYGCNWSAFWDCLTDMRGRPIHIEILGLDTLRQKCGEKASILVETLRELKNYNNDRYVHEIRIEIVDGEHRIEIQ